jgi:hypothetical protein
MTSIGENEIPSEVPLIERLRRVPKDARLIYEHSPTCSSITPVGLLSHEAADKLESLSEQNERLYDWLAETQMNAIKWMEAHDKLKAGKPYDLPSPADLPKALESLSERICGLERALRKLVNVIDGQPLPEPQQAESIEAAISDALASLTPQEKDGD